MSLLDNLPLFATDAELGPAILGKKRAGQWRGIALFLDGKKGFPAVDHQFGGRYVPAVRKWLDDRWNLNAPGLPGIDGIDGIDHPEQRYIRRKRRAPGQ